jgi:hypothetical protein
MTSLVFLDEADRAAAEVAMSTVDQSDIRGSSTRPANKVIFRREQPLTRNADSEKIPTAEN